MEQIGGVWTYAAIIAAIALSLAAPAVAQTSGGSYPETCRNVAGHLSCTRASRPRGAVGGHAYDRWQDGSAAAGSETSPDNYRFPQYLGGHSAWYGFGR